MTDPYPMPTTAALVAIDVAKMRSEVLIETPGRARRQQLTVVNTRTEHDRFVTELQALAMPVIVGLEATGNYPSAVGVAAPRGWFRGASGLVGGTGTPAQRCTTAGTRTIPRMRR